jgi:outer membrane protein insertion porin family
MAGERVLMLTIKQKVLRQKSLIVLLLFVVSSSYLFSENTNPKPILKEHQNYSDEKPLIKKIVIEGNKHVTKEAILNRVPFKEGSAFDQEKTAEAIHLLYSLGFFRQIHVEKEHEKDNIVNLYIVVEEKKMLEKIVFKGNKSVKRKVLDEKLELEKLESIDEEQLKRLVIAINNLYKDRHFHLTKISFQIEDNKENSDKASVVITIEEGPKSKIKHVHFVGNTKLPDKKLQSIIFTREDWLLGALDDAGKYSEEMLEMDKKRIEFYYRNYGYLAAKVVSAQVDFSKDKKIIDITFEIKEGDQYIIKNINVPGDEIFDETELMPYVTLEEGKPFSQEKLAATINNLKAQWGSIGYIYADVYQQILPNEETKEVDVTFYAEKGKKMYVNRINITGNKTTKDKVIRREILLEEGDLLTSHKLHHSRDSVEYLGFFEHGGTNWKMHKIKEDLVDLEMNVKEARTGRFNLEMSMGGDKNSSSSSIKGKVDFGKNNFMGSGWDVGTTIEANRKKMGKATVHFFDPHLFDSDISGGFNVYVKQDEYEGWHTVSKPPLERTVGGAMRLGFLLPKISRRTHLMLEAGTEQIYYKGLGETSVLGENKAQSRNMFNQRFKNGDNTWFAADLIKDTRNHKVYPNHGYKILFNAKTSPPFINSVFSFFKAEVDWSWYTPIIGEDSLVLGLNANIGIIDQIEKDKIIPYKELFHMGGQQTVRGFTWGGIEPAWTMNNDPLGARKAILFRAELTFPLIPDYSMKGHVFYDAGAGWDTPKTGLDMNLVKRNRCNIRHSVGFGFNLLKPTAVKVDWGYKLDRNKKEGESPHEFHLSMNTAW